MLLKLKTLITSVLVGCFVGVQMSAAGQSFLFDDPPATVILGLVLEQLQSFLTWMARNNNSELAAYFMLCFLYLVAFSVVATVVDVFTGAYDDEEFEFDA